MTDHISERSAVQQYLDIKRLRHQNRRPVNATQQYLEINRLRDQNRRLWIALAILFTTGTLQWILQFVH